MTMDRLDSFNRANSANISTGAPWTWQNLSGIGLNTAEISGNLLHSTDTTNQDNFYRAELDCLSPNHEAQITMASVNTTGVDVGLHVICRLDTNNSAPTGYMFCHSKAGQQIIKIVAGVFTLIAQIGEALPVSGDVVKGGCFGGTLTYTLNGVSTDFTDSSIATGLRCGFDIFRGDANTDVFGNDFQFGQTIATPVTTPYEFAGEFNRRDA